jgi:protein SCO1/2
MFANVPWFFCRFATRWTRSGAKVFVLSALLLAACHREEPLPRYGAVPPFALTDQGGKPFTLATVQGTPWIAAFVFTRCPSACPRVTQAMEHLQLKAKQRNLKVYLVSFSVDADFDTPEVLRKYAEQYRADLGSWSFVTGNADAIQKTAEQGLKIAVEGKVDPSKADFGITHGTQLVLVDRNGQIRGYYASNDDAALERLLEDAARLGT